jgi:tRNA(Ile)-lysidine synthase
MLKDFANKCIELKISNNIYIGYSGGVDSSVLLNLCLNIFKKPNFSIRAININYIHNKNSKNWHIFCKEQCYKNKVPITTFFINSTLHKKNLEQEYRVMRYKIFLKIINKSSSLLLAHNSSDLLETFFMNIFRGCGLTGMHGIKDVLEYKNILILRPLINFTKNQIIDYAMTNKINYITDFTNFDESFNRNFLRYNLFKNIEIKWPSFEKAILRYIKLMTSLNLYVNYRFNFFLKNFYRNNNILNLKNLKKLPQKIRNGVIKFILNTNNFKTISYTHFNEINKIIFCENKYQFIKINNYIFHRDYKNIYFKKVKKNIINTKILKYKNLYKKIKNNFILNIKTNNIFIKNLTSDLNKKNYLIIKCKTFLIILSGIWKSKFYSIFLKKKFIIKILK